MGITQWSQCVNSRTLSRRATGNTLVGLSQPNLTPSAYIFQFQTRRFGFVF